MDKPPTEPTVRALRPDDLERVIAIDRAVTGSTRRRFMEKRLAVSQLHPEDYLFVGVEQGGTLAGYALGRILHGEFGLREPVAVLDAMGVDPASQDHGHGHALVAGVLKVCRRKGVHRLHSQAEWTSHALLRFFDSTGFRLAPRVVLERGTAQAMVEAPEEI